MTEKKAWVVSVNMGYGHQRTAGPLKQFTPNQRVINANDYSGIPETDKKIWESSRKFYEFVSRFRRIPLIGNMAFSIFDKFQQIPAFYPRRDLSKPTFSVKKIFSLIKNGWGKDLIEKLKIQNSKFKINLPIIATFFTPAFMAEEFNYPGEIYCVVCDADISRAWVSLVPQKSRIKYFAPDSWAMNRLKLYGVKEENIFLTGYPLPTENIGTEKMEILKEDLRNRLLNLDPKREYFKKYKILIEANLGELPKRSNHPLTIMFAVGGAGVQKEIGVKLVKSLAEKIKRGEIKVVLAAGIKREVKGYFEENTGNIEIIFAENIEDYFEKFNQRLRIIDVLWTKPSELSFYTALGMPIIIAPPVGSQEDFNQKWLLTLGSGTLQENPNYTVQWLFDYLFSGRLAEAAMQGFMEAEKLGTFNIKRIIFKNG
ncbi:MAG: hypothetical protein COT32_02495 [Candidatus Nealsonbacteria bacterium CG08_land_8_20_14_0_20_36_22]|uniref:DUF6938 domain-containing protein n=1 Tax=Candidatus Nealsonbacteria bacterium CG08_land_8_20_14_0_20_36_22 TaxID=1974704 RepID=A0A2H0YN57_9BACT|nr:MAG: hypothetical protein COT32_02495 [Candidatus Nealsonbacteria bacterium CG08_land_8_20_14_0_20_36_22]